MTENIHPFHIRYRRQIKETLTILFIVGFYCLYRYMPFFGNLVDIVVNPAVSGITRVYSMASNTVYDLTGLNLGFLTKKRDEEFLFRVKLATYVKNKQAGPLIEMSVDQLLPRDKRKQALLSLLKFETSSVWIQSYLNELYKGGMLELYEEKAPTLDILAKKIRSEGGIRNSLVRAYAEVVLSFMTQIPDISIIRIRSVGWLSDLLAEDALFLLIPRIERETEPAVQLAIENALWDIRAISNPVRARSLLTPLYKNPPWPSVQLPIAAILSRLGYKGSVNFIRHAYQVGDFDEDRKVDLRLALSRKSFPYELKITPLAEVMMKKRERARKEQYELAYAKQLSLLRQQKMKEKVLKPKEVTASPPQKMAKAPSKPEKPVKKKSTKPIFKKEPVQVAARPEKAPEPPLPPMQYPATRKQNGYVDMVFQTRSLDVPLFEGPGPQQKLTGVTLKPGSKGKVNFLISIGGIDWYEISSKEGEGWTPGSLLKLYDLSPTGKTGTQTAQKIDPQSSRSESTFFQSNIEGAPVFTAPNEKSKQKGSLEMKVAYLASKSEKVGPNRWFYLEVGPGMAGWVRGTDIELSDLSQTKKVVIPKKQGSTKTFESAFAPEWVTASVKGVGVYKKPTIATRIIKKISPPDVYRIVEVTAAGGSEWYKIALTGKTSGWVQALDVRLTKP